MKITLISPYTDIQTLGLRILSACLKKNGHDVNLVFLQRHFLTRYENRILDEIVKVSSGSDLIGISLMTNFFENAVQITQRLKQHLDIPIIWGGVHPTVRPEECLDYADMVCIGEGEEALVELVKKMQCGEDFYNVQGMWFRNKDKIIKNKSRLLIQNLDSIPFQDYDYKTHYILHNGHIQKMDKALFRRRTWSGYVTMTTRGCPFGCTYCYNNTLNKAYSSQRPVRKRSVDNIIEELKIVKNKFQFLEWICFLDDAFFLPHTKEEIIEFTEKYKEYIGLPIQGAGIYPSAFNREKLSLLVDAGLRHLSIGIQSGSENTRKLYDRHYSNRQLEETVNIINEFRDKIISPQYDIILDNPWEAEDDLIETLMFLSKIPTPYRIALYSLTFYPGTDLYNRAKKDGIITNDLRDVYRKFYGAEGCKKTYLNRLFFLLMQNGYISKRSFLSPKMITLLTNRRLRRLKLNWILYYAVKIWVILQIIRYLLCEGSRDMLKGNYRRIIMYLRNLMPHDGEIY